MKRYRCGTVADNYGPSYKKNRNEKTINEKTINYIGQNDERVMHLHKMCQENAVMIKKNTLIMQKRSEQLIETLEVIENAIKDFGKIVEHNKSHIDEHSDKLRDIYENGLGVPSRHASYIS